MDCDLTDERSPLLGNAEQTTGTKQTYSSVSVVPADEEHQVSETEAEENRSVREGNDRMAKLVSGCFVLCRKTQLKPRQDSTTWLRCISSRNGPNCRCFIVHFDRK